MRSVNKVILIGNIGKDATGKFTPAGQHVSNFSIATGKRWKDKLSGEWKESTTWSNVVLWRSENLVNYLTKGKKVYVEGSLETRSYDKEGSKVYVTEVVADNVILLDGPSQDQQRPNGYGRSGEHPLSDKRMEITDDDVPF